METISACELASRLERGELAFSKLKIDGGEITSPMGKSLRFSDCEFDEVLFKNRVIHNAYFTKCEFSGCSFDGVNLQVCVFRDCRLPCSKFPGSSIASCSFKSCWMHTVDLRESKSVVHAEFIDCDLRHTWGLEYDSNFVKGSSLPQTAATLYGYRRRYLELSTKDRIRHFFGYFLEREFPKWQVLQRHYTASVMTLYLVLTAIALAPQVVRALFYKYLGTAQEHLAAHELLNDWEESSIVSVFLGIHDGSWPTVTLTLILVVFNLLRLFVTNSVLKLAHNQEICDTTPYKKEYAILYRIHLILIPLLILAVTAFAWNAIEFLTTNVWIPKSSNRVPVTD